MVLKEDQPTHHESSKRSVTLSRPFQICGSRGRIGLKCEAFSWNQWTPSEGFWQGSTKSTYAMYGPCNRSTEQVRRLCAIVAYLLLRPRNSNLSGMSYVSFRKFRPVFHRGILLPDQKTCKRLRVSSVPRPLSMGRWVFLTPPFRHHNRINMKTPILLKRPKI